jgi:hypothetical protein
MDRRNGFSRFLIAIVIVSMNLAVLMALLWSAGALLFDLPGTDLLRKIIASVWFLGAGILWFFVQPRWPVRLVVVISLGLILAWWLRLQPRQYRDWKPEVAQTASATLEGDRLTIHNVRNFDYKTVSQFTPRWETRSYNLENLRGLDLFVNSWGSEWMVHPIFSFDFGPDGHLCFSIEMRPELGEEYSSIGGLYRRYELIYLAADERDVVRVRTNYRGNEKTWLYRLKLPAEAARTRLMEFIDRLNELNQKPAWYNVVTDNCTTSIRAQRPAQQRKPWDWRMLLNGKADRMLYEMGVLDQSLPFDQLKEKSVINERAHAADHDPAFSVRIREGLPGME